MDTIMDFWPGGSPCHYESQVGNIHIADRQVDPAHTELLNPFTETCDIEKLELVRLEQGYDRAGAPLADGAQIIL
jgi:hypothetical protein